MWRNFSDRRAHHSLQEKVVAYIISRREIKVFYVWCVEFFAFDSAEVLRVSSTCSDILKQKCYVYCVHVIVILKCKNIPAL